MKHPIVHELEAQDDLRRELLRFCRFLHDEGYIPCQRQELGIPSFDCPDFGELVEKALQADEIDWFKRALQAGYAQESGREAVFSKDTAVSEMPQERVHEADALITDACYLLNMEVDGTLTEIEVSEWRERWLQAAEAYLEGIGGAR